LDCQGTFSAAFYREKGAHLCGKMQIKFIFGLPENQAMTEPAEQKHKLHVLTKSYLVHWLFDFSRNLRRVIAQLSTSRVAKFAALYNLFEFR